MPAPGEEAAAPSTVTTVGEGAASGVPDTLRVHATVRHRAAAVGDALAGCASAVDAATATARRFTDGDRVASRGLQLGQWHTDDGRPDGFYAQHSLEVVCPDLDRAGDLVTALGESVGERLRVDHVELFVADTTRLRVSARSTAFADARAKADELAALAGQRVDHALTVVEGAGGGHRPLEGAPRLMAASTSFEPGTATITEAVTVTWSTSPV